MLVRQYIFYEVKWHTFCKVRREGRPEIITGEIEKEITNLVEENDPSNGKVNCTIIDCAYLQTYITQKYGIEVTPEAIRLRLVASGYHYRKSEYEFTKRDKQKRREFLESILPVLMNEGVDVNFLDEARTKLLWYPDLMLPR